MEETKRFCLWMNLKLSLQRNNNNLILVVDHQRPRELMNEIVDNEQSLDSVIMTIWAALMKN